MRKLLLLFVGFAFMYQAFAQDTLFFEDFESYETGYFVEQVTNDWWDTWDGTTSGTIDPNISNDSIFFDAKSLEVVYENDLVLNLGDKTTGIYSIDFYMYVPNGYSGYYNIEHIFNSEWATEIHFNSDNTGHFYVAGVKIDFNYEMGKWLHVENLIDLEKDSITFSIDDTEIYSWQYSCLENATYLGTKQLGVLDLFGYYSDNLAYYDNICYTKLSNTISFFVTNGADFLGDATIICNSDTLSTDSDGLATMELINGTYSYTVTASGYNSATGEITVSDANTDVTITLEEEVSSLDLLTKKTAIYPTIVTNDLNVEIEGYTSVIRYNIISFYGQCIASGTIGNGSGIIDMSQYSAGIYYLKLIDDNEEMNYKIIKE